MAPKSTANPIKLTSILSWFHRSGVAHSIKDLEKALPSVGSINGMQVKDYLQALSDESKIRVEKIGSVNWYWAFANEEKKGKEDALAKAREERGRAVAAVVELRGKLEDASAQREDGDGNTSLKGEGQGGRQGLLLKYAELGKEVEALKRELAGYSDNDPVEADRRRAETGRLREEAGDCSDQIVDMEGWLKDILGHDREVWVAFKREMYGKEFDEEEEGLREL